MSTRWKTATTRGHRFWKDNSSSSAQVRRPAGGRAKELASTDAGRSNIQCFSLYANESRIEISALSKRHIHTHVEKVGSGAGRAGCTLALVKRCRCPLGDPSGLVSSHYCCDSTRGKSAFRFFEARFPVGGCLGGLHLACDYCFAVLCCFCNFFHAHTVSMRAIHVTADFSLW